MLLCISAFVDKHILQVCGYPRGVRRCLFCELLLHPLVETCCGSYRQSCPPMSTCILIMSRIAISCIKYLTFITCDQVTSGAQYIVVVQLGSLQVPILRLGDQVLGDSPVILQTLLDGLQSKGALTKEQLDAFASVDAMKWGKLHAHSLTRNCGLVVR